MINRTINLQGYRNMLWDPAWQTNEQFEDRLAAYQAKLITDPIKERLYMLSPNMFAALADGGTLDTRASFYALPQILSMIQMRRTMAFKMHGPQSKEIRVGDSIPHYTITTIELQHSKAEQEESDFFYHKKVKRLYKFSKPTGRKNPVAEGGRVNVFEARRLCHLAYSPSLEILHRDPSLRGKTYADQVRSWSNYPDYGLTWFLQKTKRDYAMTIPRDRADCAVYLAMSTPKLRYLCRILLQKVVRGNKRLLIFTDWPMVQWHLEMFLKNLGLLPHILPSERLGSGQADVGV
jgi:hypothetical protein